MKVVLLEDGVEITTPPHLDLYVEALLRTMERYPLNDDDYVVGVVLHHASGEMYEGVVIYPPDPFTPEQARYLRVCGVPEKIIQRKPLG